MTNFFFFRFFKNFFAVSHIKCQQRKLWWQHFDISTCITHSYSCLQNNSSIFQQNQILYCTLCIQVHDPNNSLTWLIGGFWFTVNNVSFSFFVPGSSANPTVILSFSAILLFNNLLKCDLTIKMLSCCNMIIQLLLTKFTPKYWGFCYHFCSHWYESICVTPTLAFKITLRSFNRIKFHIALSKCNMKFDSVERSIVHTS